jgi:tryptophan-rich sensory protein
MSALIIIGWYALAYGAMFIGGLFGMWKSARKYYKSLILPVLSPPPAVFSIVWSVLYTLIGTAGWLYQEHNNDDWDAALTWVVIFLGVSTLFTFFFFTVKDNFVSFIIMLGSLGTGITAVYYLFHGYLVSGYLFLPTVIWVGFATYLQLGILVNNRHGSYSSDEIMVFETQEKANQQQRFKLRPPPYNSSQKQDYGMFSDGRDVILV